MITLEVSRDALTNGVQLSINDVDGSGVGHGYRIAGPKFSGNGVVLLRKVLTPDEANEISQYLSRVTSA